MPSKWVQVRVDPPVICPTCNREMPRTWDPVPADRVLRWDQMQWIERRLLVGMLADHRKGAAGRGEYAEWRPLELAVACTMKYRQVLNALRRLKVTNWVKTVTRGVYRLTPETVEALAREVAPTIKPHNVRARGHRSKR